MRRNPPKPPKRRAISPASPAQRAKVADRACIRCGRGPCHPAHLIDRSLTTVGQDDALAVIPLCPDCHRQYDDEHLDIAAYLEPYWREEVAFAVVRIGFFPTLRRITNHRWTIEEAA